MDENYLSDQLIAQVAKAQNVKISQIRAVLQLIVEENATIPFIARYRKEVTGILMKNRFGPSTRNGIMARNWQKEKKMFAV